MMECWQKKKAGGGGEGGGGGRRGFKSMTDEQKTAMKAKWEENKKKMEVEKAKMLEVIIDEITCKSSLNS